jgi:hypothetical protein
LPYALSTLLGLHPDAVAGRLRIVEPRLPHHVRWLELHDVRVAAARVNLRWERRGDGTIDVSWHVRDGRLDVERAEVGPSGEDAHAEAAARSS